MHNNFLSKYSNKSNSKFSKFSFIKFIPNIQTITLEDTWLLGFVEAEGCFSISIKDKGFKTQFNIYQKGTNN